MAAAATSAGRRRFVGVRRVLAPIAEAHGGARIMLWTGAAITTFFIVLALIGP